MSERRPKYRGTVLKPCPFCGHEWLIRVTKEDGGPEFSVQCGDCFAGGPFEHTKAGAVKRWNAKLYPFVHSAPELRR